MKAEISGHELMETVQIKITGLNTLRARWWLAGWAFRLGAWISGCAVTIDHAPSAEEHPQP